jgi:hypothetical protein
MSAERPRGRVLLFWDYDTQWGSDADRALGRREAAGLGHLEFACTERLLELLARYELRACFAVVGMAARPGARPYHDPAQVRAIHMAGHEVASHAHRHEWLPGLSPPALRETLRASRTALEDCIGAPVTAFVPPYNQPFDHARALSISLSERRTAGRARVDLAGLCGALAETGYTFCRVGYRPLPLRLADRLAGRRWDRPVRPERIGGVTCLRLNTAGGFAGLDGLLARCAERGGCVVAYGHPHSLHAGGAQDERALAPFCDAVAALRAQGRIEVCLPRELMQGRVPCTSA